MNRLKRCYQKQRFLSGYLFFFCSFFSSTWAQTPAPKHHYQYEERPGIGLYYEHSRPIDDPVYRYFVAKIPSTIKVSNGPIMGIGAHMPLNKWFGLNGVVGYQKLEIDYDSKATKSQMDALIADTYLHLKKDDFHGDLVSHDLLVQAGFEAGIPIYNHYENQLLIKVLAFATGIGGKTFFDDSKFDNANLWGYAYGGGARIAWGPVSLTGGIRLSHIYWHTYFDPEYQTGDQASNDEFLLDYDSPISPYAKITWALY